MRKCHRCYANPANPVLCNECQKFVKEEFRLVVEEVCKFIDDTENENANTRR